MFPISPENTSFFLTPFSSSHTSMLAEPSKCPMSVNLICIPSHTSTSSPYRHGVNLLIMPSASSILYSGCTVSMVLLLLAFLFFQSASISCICAQSRSMMLLSCVLASVAYTLPLKPLAYNSGSRPEWSTCACVRKT